MSVVTRFAPSPTGHLHIGSVRTALFNWLFARRAGGKMLLRIEDTDRQRSTTESVDLILAAMQWLGLDWDQDPIYQTQRFDRYTEVIDRLLAEDRAYYCFCSRERLEQVRQSQREQGLKPRYDHFCRQLNRRPGPAETGVVRFKNPLQGKVVFDDVVRGGVVIDNREMDDLIILRSDGTPTYNLTVVVDDIDMGITHVIRGDDHTNNTPRQINIFHALGARLPVFAHVPAILGQDGQRLSKRHGAVGVLDYREWGIFPEALCNYLLRLGWSHGDQEIFSRDEMTHLFDLTQVNPSAAAFDRDKLLWLNQHYIRQADPARLTQAFTRQLQRRNLEPSAGPSIERVVEVMRERARTLEEMLDKVIWLYSEVGEFDATAARKHLRPAAAALLQDCCARLGRLPHWQETPIADVLDQVLADHAVGLIKLAQPLRVALSGSAVTPPIAVTLELVGQQRCVARITRALEWIAECTENNASQ